MKNKKPCGNRENNKICGSVKNNKLCGSMTVEISLLMPIIIGVLLFLIFTLFYLHDVCAMEKGCATALLRGSLEIGDEEAYQKMTEAMEDIRILYPWNRSENCTVEKDLVTVTVNSEMPIHEGLFHKLLSNVYEISFQREARRVDGVAYVRTKRSRK